LAPRESPDVSDRKGLQARGASRVLPAHRAPRANKGLPARRVRRAVKDLLEKRANQVPRASGGLRAETASKALPVGRVSKAQKESRALRGRKDRRASRVHRASRARPDLLGLPVQRRCTSSLNSPARQTRNASSPVMLAKS
jgi:hypothetical protein